MSSNIPVQVQGMSSASNISAGEFHTCARLSDWKVRCWGKNMYGQLGVGSTNRVSIPAVAGSGAFFEQLSVGGEHTCAKNSGGGVQCWGANKYGQLGNSSVPYSGSPVPVAGLSGVSQNISAGLYHTCSQHSSGAIECWGKNIDGQLGNNSTTDSSTPVAVIGMSSAIGLSSGHYHTCALASDATARCWGKNDFGQLGNGSISASVLTPAAVVGLSSVALVVAGGEHSCARLNDASVYCWGLNDYGQLGTGNNTDSSSPVAVAGLTPGSTSYLSIGEFHSCAVLTGGQVKCWGDNLYGQLGDSGAVASSLPVFVSGISNSSKVFSGHNHTCVLLTDSTVQCWGNNEYGQLGNGNRTNSNIPVPVRGINTAVEIGGGAFHTCARLADSTLRCWGLNDVGELGLGFTGRLSAPSSSALDSQAP